MSSRPFWPFVSVRTVFNSSLYLRAKPSTSTSSVRFRTVWAGTSGNKAESGLAHTRQTSRAHLCQCSNFWALKQDSSSPVSLLIDLTRASFSVCPLYSGTIADCPTWDSKNCSSGASRSGRSHLKCDGTRAETRFRLSVKRTSAFK